MNIFLQLKIPRFPYQEEAAITIRKEKTTFSKSQRFAKNKRETMVALMHLVLREYGKIRPVKQMCQELNVDVKLVMKQVWMLKAINANKCLINIQRITSKDYLVEYATQITSKKETLAFANSIVLNVHKLGGNPISIAAGALFYACKISKTPIQKTKSGRSFIFHLEPLIPMNVE